MRVNQNLILINENTPLRQWFTVFHRHCHLHIIALPQPHLKRGLSMIVIAQRLRLVSMSYLLCLSFAFACQHHQFFSSKQKHQYQFSLIFCKSLSISSYFQMAFPLIAKNYYWSQDWKYSETFWLQPFGLSLITSF